jgi:hypothetical protein
MRTWRQISANIEHLIVRRLDLKPEPISVNTIIIRGHFSFAAIALSLCSPL